MNTNIKAYKTITTDDHCGICKSESRLTHGFTNERGNPVHIENCPECGEIWSVVCYPCPDCALIREDAQRLAERQSAAERMTG